MTTAWQQSTELATLVGAFSGGLNGAPGKIRASSRSKVRAVEFHYQQSGAGNIGDNIEIADLFPTDRLCDYMLLNDTSTASVTFAICGWDRNLHGGVTLQSKGGGATPDYTYDSAFSVATAGVFRPTVNFTGPVEVGVDPNGDQSTGNVPPGYGSFPVQIFIKVAGAGIATSTNVRGYLLVDVGN